MRLVLDTNVVVAGLAYPSGPPGKIVAAWRSGTLQIVLSQWILTECERVLPRLGRFTTLSAGDIRDLVDSLALMADIVEPDADADALARAAAAGVHDAADELVLATLLGSDAHMLITGDRNLLVLSARFPILSPAGFCARYVP